MNRKSRLTKLVALIVAAIFACQTTGFAEVARDRGAFCLKPAFDYCPDEIVETFGERHRAVRRMHILRQIIQALYAARNRAQNPISWDIAIDKVRKYVAAGTGVFESIEPVPDSCLFRVTLVKSLKRKAYTIGYDAGGTWVFEERTAPTAGSGPTTASSEWKSGEASSTDPFTRMVQGVFREREKAYEVESVPFVDDPHRRVYRAREISGGKPGRLVAIKVARPEADRDGAYHQFIKDTLKVWQRGGILKGRFPNLVRVYEAGFIPVEGLQKHAPLETDATITEALAALGEVGLGLHYQVMEFLDGRDLEVLLAEGFFADRGDDLPGIIRFLADNLVRGMNKVHRGKLVHGELLMHDIVIDEDMTWLKVGDLDTMRSTRDFPDIAEWDRAPVQRICEAVLLQTASRTPHADTVMGFFEEWSDEAVRERGLPAFARALKGLNKNIKRSTGPTTASSEFTGAHEAEIGRLELEDGSRVDIHIDKVRHGSVRVKFYAESGGLIGAVHLVLVLHDKLRIANVEVEPHSRGTGFSNVMLDAVFKGLSDGAIMPDCDFEDTITVVEAFPTHPFIAKGIEKYGFEKVPYGSENEAAAAIEVVIGEKLPGGRTPIYIEDGAKRDTFVQRAAEEGFSQDFKFEEQPIEGIQLLIDVYYELKDEGRAVLAQRLQDPSYSDIQFYTGGPTTASSEFRDETGGAGLSGEQAREIMAQARDRWELLGACREHAIYVARRCFEAGFEVRVMHDINHWWVEQVEPDGYILDANTEGLSFTVTPETSYLLGERIVAIRRDLDEARALREAGVYVGEPDEDATEQARREADSELFYRGELRALDGLCESRLASVDMKPGEAEMFLPELEAERARVRAKLAQLQKGKGAGPTTASTDRFSGGEAGSGRAQPFSRDELEFFGGMLGIAGTEGFARELLEERTVPRWGRAELKGEEQPAINTRRGNVYDCEVNNRYRQTFGSMHKGFYADNRLHLSRDYLLKMPRIVGHEFGEIFAERYLHEVEGWDLQNPRLPLLEEACALLSELLIYRGLRRALEARGWYSVRALDMADMFNRRIGAGAQLIEWMRGIIRISLSPDDDRIGDLMDEATTIKPGTHLAAMLQERLSDVGLGRLTPDEFRLVRRIINDVISPSDVTVTDEELDRVDERAKELVARGVEQPVDTARERAQALLERARRHMTDRRYTEAEELLLQARRLDPRFLSVLGALLRLCRDQNRYEDMLGCAREMIRIRPRHPRNMSAYAGCGEALTALGRFREAREVLGEGLGVEPDNFWLLAIDAEAAIELGQYADAIANCRRALAADPQDKNPIIRRLARAQRLNGEPAEARQTLRRPLERRPKNHYLLVEDAAAAIALGELDDAIQNCHRALRVSGKNRIAYQLLAEAQRLKGDTGASISSCTRGLQHNQGDPGLLAQMALALADNGEISSARAVLRRATEQDVELSVEERRIIASAEKLLAEKEAEPEATISQEAGAEEPETDEERGPSDEERVAVLITGANTHLEAGRHKEALANAREIFKIDPSNLDAHVLTAKAQSGLGRSRKVREACAAGLAVDPENAELLALQKQVTTAESGKLLDGLPVITPDDMADQKRALKKGCSGQKKKAEKLPDDTVEFFVRCGLAQNPRALVGQLSSISEKDVTKTASIAHLTGWAEGVLIGTLKKKTGHPILQERDADVRAGVRKFLETAVRGGLHWQQIQAIIGNEHNLPLSFASAEDACARLAKLQSELESALGSRDPPTTASSEWKHADIGEATGSLTLGDGTRVTIYVKAASENTAHVRFYGESGEYVGYVRLHVFTPTRLRIGYIEVGKDFRGGQRGTQCSYALLDSIFKGLKEGKLLPGYDKGRISITANVVNPLIARVLEKYGFNYRPRSTANAESSEPAKVVIGENQPDGKIPIYIDDEPAREEFKERIENQDGYEIFELTPGTPEEVRDAVYVNTDYGRYASIKSVLKNRQTDCEISFEKPAAGPATASTEWLFGKRRARAKERKVKPVKWKDKKPSVLFVKLKSASRGPRRKDKIADYLTIGSLASALRNKNFLRRFGNACGRDEFAFGRDKDYPTFDTHVVDLAEKPDNVSTEEYLREYIKRHRIDPMMVCASAMSRGLDEAKEVAEAADKLMPGALKVAGGAHASVAPQECLERVGYDVACIGAGVEAIMELAFETNARRETDLSQVSNIAFKDAEGQVRLTTDLDETPEYVLDINEYPDPSDSLGLFINDVDDNPEENAKVLAYVYAGEGCAWNCDFCAQKAIHRGAIRERSADVVFAEIKKLWEKGFRRFFIIQESFTRDNKRIERFLELIEEEKARNPDFRFGWAIEARADQLTYELLARMKEGGLQGIDIGLETGDQVMLDSVNKGVKLEQVRKVIEWCGKPEGQDDDYHLGINTHLYMMVGLPGQDWQSILRSAIFLKENPPFDYLQMSPDVFVAMPYLGTELAKLGGITVLMPEGGSLDWPDRTPDAFVTEEELVGENFTETGAMVSGEILEARIYLEEYGHALIKHIQHISYQVSHQYGILADHMLYMLERRTIRDLIVRAREGLDPEKRKAAYEEILERDGDEERDFGTIRYQFDGKFREFSRFLAHINFSNGFDAMKCLEVKRRIKWMRLCAVIWAMLDKKFDAAGFDVDSEAVGAMLNSHLQRVNTNTLNMMLKRVESGQPLEEVEGHVTVDGNTISAFGLRFTLDETTKTLVLNTGGMTPEDIGPTVVASGPTTASSEWQDKSGRPPESVFYSLSAAKARQEGNYYRAGKLIERSIALDDKDPFTWTEYAVLCLETGRLREAHACIGKALEFAPSDEIARAVQARILLADNRPVEAVNVLERLVADAPDFDVKGLLVTAQRTMAGKQSGPSGPTTASSEWEENVAQKVWASYSNLGEIQDIEQPSTGRFGGVVFVTTKEGKRFALKQHVKRNTVDTARYEWSLIKRVKQAGFPTAGVVNNDSGDFCSVVDDNIYMVYEFIEGDQPKYGDVAGPRVISTARTLAAYHNAVDQFTPEGSPISGDVYFDLYGEDLVAKAERRRAQIDEKEAPDRTEGECLFLERFDYFMAQIKRLQTELPHEVYGRLPRLVVQGDYHPENIKLKGDEVAGVFDWDFSREEIRLYDLANSMINRPAAVDAAYEFNVDDVVDFVRAYQETVDRKLTAEELKILPVVWRAELIKRVFVRANQLADTEKAEFVHNFYRMTFALMEDFDQKFDQLAQRIAEIGQTGPTGPTTASSEWKEGGTQWLNTAELIEFMKQTPLTFETHTKSEALGFIGHIDGLLDRHDRQIVDREPMDLMSELNLESATSVNMGNISIVDFELEDSAFEHLYAVYRDGQIIGYGLYNVDLDYDQIYNFRFAILEGTNERNAYPALQLALAMCYQRFAPRGTGLTDIRMRPFGDLRGHPREYAWQTQAPVFFARAGFDAVDVEEKTVAERISFLRAGELSVEERAPLNEDIFNSRLVLNLEAPPAGPTTASSEWKKATAPAADMGRYDESPGGKIRSFMYAAMSSLRNGALPAEYGSQMTVDNRTLTLTEDSGGIDADDPAVNFVVDCHTCAPIVTQTVAGPGSVNHILHFMVEDENDEIGVLVDKNDLDGVYSYIGDQECTFIIPFSDGQADVYSGLADHLLATYKNSRVLLVEAEKYVSKSEHVEVVMPRVKSGILMREGVGINVGLLDPQRPAIPVEGVSRTVAITWDKARSLFDKERLVKRKFIDFVLEEGVNSAVANLREAAQEARDRGEELVVVLDTDIANLNSYAGDLLEALGELAGSRGFENLTIMTGSLSDADFIRRVNGRVAETRKRAKVNAIAVARATNVAGDEFDGLDNEFRVASVDDSEVMNNEELLYHIELNEITNILNEILVSDEKFVTWILHAPDDASVIGGEEIRRRFREEARYVRSA